MMKSATSSESLATVGRLKENVCGDLTLRDTATSASSLSAMSFETPPGLGNGSKDSGKHSSDVPDATYASSSSSTCTRESDAGAFSDVDSSAIPAKPLERGMSEKLNAKIVLRQTSRQGRSTQRWVKESGETIRLVTGCVPILKGGKIMFVSASRKPEWILPKGGWELDETLEESAIRECFEEAGVLGVLGPKLKHIEYETRKAKKRRLEEEEQSQRSQKARTEEGSDSSVDGRSEAKTESASASESETPRIRKPAAPGVEAAPSSYSKVRMTLFPLYVSQVLEKWPEDGRFRKAVGIDEAIQLLDGRPELKEVIAEVKSRGLHLLTRPPCK